MARRHAAAALIVTLLLILTGGRQEVVLVQDAHPFVVAETGRIPLGPPVSLAPGRYRMRAVVVRGIGDTASTPSVRGKGSVGDMATTEIAHLALGVAGGPEPPDGVSFRAFDFARDSTRVVQFVLRVRSATERQWTWTSSSAHTGLRVLETRISRERSLATGALPDALRGDLARRSIPALAILAALLVLLLPPLRRWASVPPSRSGGLSITLLGLLAYAAAGSALGALLLLGDAGSGTKGGWMWLPALDPLTPPPAALLTAVAVAATIAFILAIRHRPALVWALPIAAVGLGYAGTLVMPYGDFLVYYRAGLALWSGGDPYVIRPERVLNPPPFVLACALLPVLSAPAAGFVWFGLKAAAAAWCVPLARIGLTTFTDARTRYHWVRPEIVALAAGGRLIGMDLQFGNTNVLSLVALLAAAAAWAGRRSVTTAAFLAGGVALKVTPAVAIVATGLAGRWRWAATTLVVSLTVLITSAVALEWRAPGAGWGFVREATPRPGDLSMGRVDNQSLRGMTDRWVGGAEIRTRTVRSVPTLRLGARAARAVELLLAGAVVAVLALLSRRAARANVAAPEGKRAWASLWAGATIAMLLLSPGSWTVHFALLYVPLVVLADRALRGDRVAGAAFTIVAAVVIVPATSRFLSDLCTAWSSLTLASLVALAALGWRERGAPLNTWSWSRGTSAT